MSDSYSLLCYTRVPTSREEANNEDIAFSMHLALRSHLDGSWTPLNENYGIFFAAGVPIAAATPESRRACTAAARFKTDPYTTVRAASDAVAHGAAMPGVDIELKSLKDPHLFRLASGRFAVAATRTARGGGADGSERSAFLLATSRDLTSYDQRGLVLLGPTSGVHRPTVIYNDAERRYVIRWHDDDGHAMRAVCADIIAAVGTTLPAEPDDTSEPIAASNANDVNATSVRRDYGIADAVPGNEIDITEQEAATLIARFGRVYNTGVTVPSMTVSADLYDGEARDHGQTAVLRRIHRHARRRLGRRTARRPRRRRRSWQAQAGRTPYGPRSHPSDRLSRAVRRRTRRSVRVRMELQR